MSWENQLQTILAARKSDSRLDPIVQRGVSHFLKYHRRTSIRNLLLFNFASLLSLCVLVYSGLLVVNNVFTTGLLDIVSLAISDFSIVISNWDSFLYSIVEVLPALSLAGVFAGLFWLTITAHYSIKTWNLLHKKITI